MISYANPPEFTKRAEYVRSEFQRRGLSIAEWARQHKYSTALVYQVLSGKKRCLRGQSHQVAVCLGLKQGLTESVAEIDRVLMQHAPTPIHAQRRTR